MKPRTALILGVLGLLAFGAGYWWHDREVAVLPAASSAAPALAEVSRPAAVVRREAALKPLPASPVKQQPPRLAVAPAQGAEVKQQALESGQIDEEPRMSVETSRERWIFYPAVGVAGGAAAVAALKGRVLWSGNVPAPVKEHRQSDPYCARFVPAAGRPPFVGLGGLVRDAVVWLAGAEAGPVPTFKSALLEIDKCSFSPRVQTARVGQELEIVNRDNILHNVHVYEGSRTVSNKGLLSGRDETQTTLDKPGIYIVRCDVHRWERATVVVTAHAPAVVTTDGRFDFEGVVPGVYTLGAWEEVAGVSTRRVSLLPGESSAELHLNESAFAAR